MSELWREDPYVAAHPDHLPFWQAAEEGRLLGKACTDCGKHHWYPRTVCPFCRSSNTAWVPLSGRGEVYACSTLRRADPPYTLAYVQLAEGPAMLTNLVDMAEADMRIGAPVQVVFQRTADGRMAPKFTGITTP
ncbi:Zn-ribbon domain-containing OB-fold protein [Pseudorhodoferax sp.]|uniref:Zn-ribbon domain-containing OB-fold protein n=1 Tax=Pseudorhodoferax sp. TaxID=1993553 RepID=UPI002DD6797C|nr:Zn-ribbon domain-containing OB-fold protein [Pseudorhodoferax sp.]